MWWLLGLGGAVLLYEVWNKSSPHAASQAAASNAPVLSPADQANAASLGLTPQEYVNGGLVGSGDSQYPYGNTGDN